jgi:carbon starvation protein
LGIPISAGLTFGMLAFATFVYDTLDVATRLGRYLMEELLNIRGTAGRWIATLLTLGIPMAYLFLGSNLQSALHSTKPIWLTIWPLFGSSNQLLAALTFLMLAAWFKNNTKSKKQLAPWLVLPAFFMFITTMVALGLQCYDNFLKLGAGNDPIALINFILSLALITISILFLGQWFSKMHKK